MRRFASIALIACCLAAPAAAQDGVMKGLDRTSTRTHSARIDVDGVLHTAASTGAAADGSSTTAGAGVSQIVFAPNPDRRMLMCENPISAIELLLVGIDETANPTTSIEVGPGGSVLFASSWVPSGQVTVRAATAGHRFICKQG